jgi:putative ABC transport system permease protein
LALAEAVIILWIFRTLAIDIQLSSDIPLWSLFPLQFSLAPGPLLFFYVRKLTRPEYKFKSKDLLHFVPSLLALVSHALEVGQSVRSGLAIYKTPAFYLINPVLQVLTFVSVSMYLYSSYRLTNRFYQSLKFTGGDRFRYKFRWLQKLLISFGLVWVLWIPLTVGEYFFHHHQTNPQDYFPFYILLSVMAIRFAVICFFKQDAGMRRAVEPLLKSPLPSEMKQLGSWLKKSMQSGLYYQDPELSLNALAEKLNLHPHELSRIINTALKKKFSDFVNECRVAEIIRKMRDPANDRLTLLGIAYDAGFNSKATFNRIFKQMTGKTAREYKLSLKKERSTYDLGPFPDSQPIVLHSKTISVWEYKKINRTQMLKNYLKVAWRNITRNRAYSAINIFGLATGTFCCLYILLYVQDQYNYDKHQADVQNIYRLNTIHTGHGKRYDLAISATPAGPALKHDFPEVAEYTRVVPFIGIDKHLVTYKNKNIWDKAAFIVDPNFFDIFTYHRVSGNLRNALAESYTVVLLKPMADKLFGTEDPIGKTITIDNSWNRHDYQVTAVVDESLGKSHLHADIFVGGNIPRMGQFNPNNPSWSSNTFIATYVKLLPGTDVAALQRKFSAFVEKYVSADMKKWGGHTEFYLQPLSRIHTRVSLDNTGIGQPVNPSFLNLLMLIAAIIQVIACINFMNLSTARASKRAKEVGVRKVIGAGRITLMKQFLAESFLLTLMAVVLAIPLMIVLMPWLDRLTGTSVVLSSLNNIRIWGMLLGLTLITGLVAGSYPAFYLSAFNAIRVIKGNFTSHISAPVIRKGLVVVQFVLSIVLIFGILVIYVQLNYIRKKDLGFDPEQRIVFTINSQGSFDHLSPFMDDLRQLAGVKEVSNASQYLGNPALFNNNFQLPGQTSAESKNSEYVLADRYFMAANGISLYSGRDFREGDSDRVLINVSFARDLGLDPNKAEGVRLHDDQGRQFEVVGVMKDFNFSSLRFEVRNFLVWINNPRYGLWPTITVHANTHNYRDLLSKIDDAWKKNMADVPFDYVFMDESVQKLYETDIIMSRVINAFTVMAILISSLGLFGLATFSAEQKKKEIGIRKVLGAGVPVVVRLLSREFLFLVIISWLIASPIASWAMNKWLQGFAYRISIQWWMFALVGVIALVVAMVSVGFQAIRAALMNPVKALRSE